MTSIIKAEKLFFEYHKAHSDKKTIAIDGIDLDVEKGSFIAVLGHNGSGKSTFAKQMNGLLLPSGGTIYIKNMKTSEEGNQWKIRQTVGMVFQNPDNQIVATIVEEDVAFGPENLGVEPAEIRNRVDKALATVEMSEYATQSSHMLSGGQKQRIAIAGILAMKPEVLVFDEPTAMLDPAGRKEVLDTIIRLNKEEGITIVLITHFMDEAIFADKVYVMEAGKMTMNGTPKKIFCQVEKLKAIGLDVPQVTELCWELKKEGINLPDDILSVEEMVVELCRLK